MVDIRTRDVFATMRPELLRVEERLEQAAAIDQPDVADLLLGLVRAGGKRLRPIMLLLAARQYDPNPEHVVAAAAGVELLHTASLVHDDTVDRAALRRGQPTLNSMLSSGAVILLGDFLFAKSALLAASTNSPRVVSVFAAILVDICDGQLLEVFGAHRLEQSTDDYRKRIYGKTASLFAGAAEMGAILCQAPEWKVQNFRDYGRALGMAFQIVDDVLDVREGTQQLGKPAGHDLTQGTVTLPTILYAAGLDSSSSAYRKLSQVASGDQSEPDAVRRVVQDIRRSGALESAMDQARSYANQARERAAAVMDPETRDMLEELTEIVVNRSS